MNYYIELLVNKSFSKDKYFQAGTRYYVHFEDDKYFILNESEKSKNYFIDSEIKIISQI